MKISILKRSIGFDGGDGVNKTRFAFLIWNALRSKGQEPLYCALPQLHTITYNLIANAHRMGIPKACMAPLFAANRTEILQVLEDGWLLKGEDRWVIFDRTRRAGEAYAWAGGERNIEWLRALDLYFPDPEIGIFLWRPPEEALSITSRRGTGFTHFKDELDQDLLLQRGVAEHFQRIVNESPNWHMVDVSGLAFDVNSFAKWEVAKGLAIWTLICDSLNKKEWLKNAERLIERNRVGLFRRPDIEAMHRHAQERWTDLWREKARKRGIERFY